MITSRTPSSNTERPPIDYCDQLGCVWMVLPGGAVSACLRCGAPYPFTVPGMPAVVAGEDEEPPF